MTTKYTILVQGLDGTVYVSFRRYLRYSTALRVVRDKFYFGSYWQRHKAWAIERTTWDGITPIASIIVAQSREWNGQRTYTDLVPRKAS